MLESLVRLAPPAHGPVPRGAEDPSAIVEATREVPVQVNGKLRGKFTAAAGSTQDQLKEMALALPELKGLTPKKVIVVPGKLVNVVV